MKKLPQVYVPMSADIIHPGHIRLIKEAKRYGEVTVGLLSDHAIKEKKGKAPAMTYDERSEVVSYLKDVTKVIEQKSPDYQPNLRLLKPNFVVHGDDWSNTAKQSVLDVICEWEGELIEMDYSIYLASSTIIKKRIKDLL